MSLKQPKSKKVEQWNWSECIAYLEKKHKFKHDDYANHFGDHARWLKAKGLKYLDGKYYSEYQKEVTDGKWVEPPFLNFWHYLISTQEIHNGCFIYFDDFDLDILYEPVDEPKDKDLPKQYRGWRQKIIGYILDEFGKGKHKKCEFYCCW